MILEHQSTVVRWMGLRVFDYARRVWEWWTDRHSKALHLPPVVGLVVSHDPRGWKSPTHLWDLRETDPELEAVLGAKQPDVDFFLEDLQVRPDEQISSWELDAVGKLTLLLLKHGRTAPDMLAWVSGWRGLFAATEEQWREGQEPQKGNAPTRRRTRPRPFGSTLRIVPHHGIRRQQHNGSPQGFGFRS